MDLGLGAAGFKTLWANDLFDEACDTFETNISEVERGDIRLKTLPALDAGLDVLAAGFPCQPYSNAGSRKGTSDLLRGTLFTQAIHAVSQLQPKVVIFENVRGLMSIKMDGQPVVEIICRSLDDLGYSVAFKLVDTALHRVAQRRIRLVMLAIRKDLGHAVNLFPEPISPNGLSVGETIFEIPESAPNMGEWKTLNPQALNLGSMIGEGQCWRDVPYDKMPPRLKKIMDNIERYKWPRFYARLARHQIAGTITAEFKPENACVWHPLENRAMSVREIARIQSFPDWFKFEGSLQSKYRQIGNAVPPRLAFEIGERIAAALTEKCLTIPDSEKRLSYEMFSSKNLPLRPSDPPVEYKNVDSLKVPLTIAA